MTEYVSKENIKKLLSDADLESDSYDYDIGKSYFIRTVTHAIVGRLVHKTEKELILDRASWIADTGRYHQTVQTGLFDSNAEIEPYDASTNLHVNRSAFIDAFEWKFDLPKEAK